MILRRISLVGVPRVQFTFSQVSDQLARARRSLREADPEIYQTILRERERQFNGVNLIASENYCSNACFEAVGSVLNNKYAEGYPGARYYGGTQHVDAVEVLCQQRALTAFSLSPDSWGVNVQSLSGSPANLAVYTGLLNPHDRIMSLDLPHGGHLSHGFQTAGKKISAISKYFEVLPYRLDEATGRIDYEALHRLALLYRPRLIVAGASSYSRLIDYSRFRSICDEIGAYLLVDMAHPSGLIAAKVIPSPFPYADVVTTTTHKTLRGPRGSLIFYRVGKKGEEEYDLKGKIDSAVFPGLQGGPHMHTISGIAVALREAAQPAFHEYQTQVLANLQSAVRALTERGYQLVSGGSDIHLTLIDLRSKGIDGARVEATANEVELAINKNTVPGDKSALVPSGVRIGSPAMTTRGCKEKDFETIAGLLDRTVKVATAIMQANKGMKLKEFKEAVKHSEEAKQLKADVGAFAKQFPVPGGLLE